ncbi:MAG: Bug family tripartite tricarboxylate transporter substrate binding protein [Pigmentiphaga sp.]|uniref:Bug family tripartite tricarboxylate transporter substrate binding protein n=1 Tax=Pigmentiphaga sp. TaxID=1977564 RepID=UPI003B5311B8
MQTLISIARAMAGRGGSRFLAALAVAAGMVHGAQAQTVAPVKVVVPYPAGGVTDQAARVVVERMGKALGRTMVVENRPGAGSRIGTVAVQQAEPDGNTLLFTNISYSTLPLVDAGFRQDPVTALAPVGRVAVYAPAIVVHPSLPVRTLPEFIEYARKHPGKLSYGSAGIGSGAHFGGEYLKVLTGTDLVHVPYKSTSAALNDLIGGRISMAIDATAKPYVDAGKLRALAIMGSRRDPRMPDVPTAGEGGVRGLDFDSWAGMLAPAGTPPGVIASLNEALNAAVQDPAVQAQFATMGLTPTRGGPEALTGQLREDAVIYRKIVEKAHLRLVE